MSDNIQFSFSDKGSALISKTDILEQRIEALETMMLAQRGENIKYIKNPTHDQCIAALNDPFSIKYMKKTFEFCMVAVCGNPHTIEFIPLNDFPEDQRNELLKTAVSTAGTTLKYIPECYMTPELCLMAIHSEIVSIMYVPVKYEYAQVWRSAVYIQPRYAALTEECEELYRDMKDYALRIDPMSIEYIKDPPEEAIEKYIKAYPSYAWDHSGKVYVNTLNPSKKIKRMMFWKSMGKWKVI